MDVVGVMAAYLPVVRVCTALSREAILNTLKYFIIILIVSTNYIFVHLLDNKVFNPSNAELNHICRLLALLGAHHILHVRRVRVKRRSC